MYKQGTILTFTSLTHASAAADLFGVDALETEVFNHAVGRRQWLKGFYCAKTQLSVGSSMCSACDVWRIILDTPEKVRWFEPQVGDDFRYGGGVSKIREIRGDRILHDRGIIDRSDIRKIIYRGEDKPFPQPQDVKLGETV